MSNIVIDGIMEAVGIIFYIFIFYFIVYLVQGVLDDSSKFWKLIKGLSTAAFIALMVSHNIGSPDCESVEYTSGICEQYSDTEYEVSDAYKLKMFTFYLVLFGIPVVYATYTKRNFEKEKNNRLKDN